MFASPLSVYADNSANNTSNFSNPNWQAMHPADGNWNHQHNFAYSPPEYQFDTSFPVEQWARPTTSNVAPDREQNIRRDRHSAFVPPPHGSSTGHFSGEFSTDRVNPFAPMANNNPNASRAVGVEQSVFAVLPGEAGVNVRPEVSGGSGGSNFLAPTSISPNGSGVLTNNNAPFQVQGNPTNPSTSQSGGAGGFTVNHRPIDNTPVVSQQPQHNQGANRVTTVALFNDGTMGTLRIPALNRVASIRPGIDMRTLDNYIGHFPNTSQWDGNVALASHNRGPGSFFAGIWTLNHGDRIYLETTMGTRIYEVVSIQMISATDTEVLNHTHNNTLTLITCVYYQQNMRWRILATQV